MSRQCDGGVDRHSEEDPWLDSELYLGLGLRAATSCALCSFDRALKTPEYPRRVFLSSNSARLEDAMSRILWGLGLVLWAAAAAHGKDTLTEEEFLAPLTHGHPRSGQTAKRGLSLEPGTEFLSRGACRNRSSVHLGPLLDTTSERPPGSLYSSHRCRAPGCAKGPRVDASRAADADERGLQPLGSDFGAHGRPCISCRAHRGSRRAHDDTSGQR